MVSTMDYYPTPEEDAQQLQDFLDQYSATLSQVDEQWEADMLKRSQEEREAKWEALQAEEIGWEDKQRFADCHVTPGSYSTLKESLSGGYGI